MICVFCVLFLLSQARRLNSRCPACRSGGRLCLKRWFDWFFKLCFSTFGVKFIHLRYFVYDTHLATTIPVVGSTGHVGRQSPARGLYAPKSPMLFGACDGHAPPFLAVHGEEWVLRLGAIGDGVCPPRATVSGEVCLCLHCRRLVLSVFLLKCCVFLLFFEYSLSVYYSNFIRIFIG
jgi:hypothetical protein